MKGSLSKVILLHSVILSQPLSDFQCMNDVSGEMEMRLRVHYQCVVGAVVVLGGGSGCGVCVCGGGGGCSQQCRRSNSRF